MSPHRGDIVGADIDAAATAVGAASIAIVAFARGAALICETRFCSLGGPASLYIMSPVAGAALICETRFCSGWACVVVYHESGSRLQPPAPATAATLQPPAANFGPSAARGSLDDVQRARPTARLKQSER